MPVDYVVAQARSVLLQQASALAQCAERLCVNPELYDNAVRILYETLQGHPNAYRIDEKWRQYAATTDTSDKMTSSVNMPPPTSSGLTDPKAHCCTATDAAKLSSSCDCHNNATQTSLLSWAAPRPGKIVVSGVGKSGHIARKVCATLQSTGSLAVFLHPTEALHGDLGIISPGDALLVFSHSGRTEELVRLVRILRVQQRVCRVVAVCGDATSPLSQLSDAWVDARVEAESDPVLPAPTASTTLALALGDCLALTLARMRAVTIQDFANNHPGGNLGRVLNACGNQSLANGLSSETGFVKLSSKHTHQPCSESSQHEAWTPIEAVSLSSDSSLELTYADDDD
jgi:D-arabinose 5-phosphate isomerase GutQ